VVVGEAEAEVERAYLERVRALVSDLNLGDRFVFAGARRDIPEVMRALDLFVLTSRHEGFGRVVAEAMTARRPIVVTDEGALPELVGGGRYGLTAPPATPRAFAAQMLRLLEDKDYAEQLAAAAAAAAIQFDSTHIAVRVAERYRQLLERRLQAK
jgi:glycosyltransferase involved in cell wall biosynthesis